MFLRGILQRSRSVRQLSSPAYEEITAQTHLLNGIYADDITAETYLRLYELLIYDKITPEELAQMRQEEAVKKEDQKSYNANMLATGGVDGIGVDVGGGANGGGISTFTVPENVNTAEIATAQSPGNMANLPLN